jgi:hypothetical protein
VDPAEREKLQRELTNQRQSEAWERWVLAVRSDSRIEILGQPSAAGRG